MKVLIREVVDVDSDINLSQLGLWEKITVSIRYQFTKTKTYRRRKEKEEAREYKARAEREEMLKSLILTNIQRELIENKEMSKMGYDCVCLKLYVNRSFEETLRTIKDHKEFIAYHMVIEECDPDLVRSFDKVPIILSIRQKVLGGDLYESGYEKAI